VPELGPQVQYKRLQIEQIQEKSGAEGSEGMELTGCIMGRMGNGCFVMEEWVMLAVEMEKGWMKPDVVRGTQL
jgi:hypothetical protein